MNDTPSCEKKEEVDVQNLSFVLDQGKLISKEGILRRSLYLYLKPEELKVHDLIQDVENLEPDEITMEVVSMLHSVRERLADYVDKQSQVVKEPIKEEAIANVANMIPLEPTDNPAVVHK